MQALQSLSALVRSPDAAVIAAQLVQAGDLATRQGQASLLREAERRGSQVQAQSESQASSPIGPRDTAQEREKKGRRREAAKSAPESSFAPSSAHRLDILA